MDQGQPKRTILIVDDQEIEREILISFLEQEYTLLTAQNGREALDILEEKKADISAVLLDIVMPVMDGYAVLETLRERELLCQIPVG